MSTDAGGTAAPVTPLHATLASAEQPMHDAPRGPAIEIDDDGRSNEELLERAEDAIDDAHDAIAANQHAIAAAAGNPAKYQMPMQVSALEHAVVAGAATQLVIARTLVSICDHLERLSATVDHMSVGLVRERTGIDEQFEAFLKLLRDGK